MSGNAYLDDQLIKQENDETAIINVEDIKEVKMEDEDDFSKQELYELTFSRIAGEDEVKYELVEIDTMLEPGSSSVPAFEDVKDEITIEEHPIDNLGEFIGASISRPSKEVRTLEERLRIIEQVENNPGEKRTDAAKRLGLPISTLSTIISKKDEIRLLASKYGPASKKRKSGRESNFRVIEDVLFEWCQKAKASNLPIDGPLLKEKGKQIALRFGVKNFSASNGWTTKFKERHGLVFKKSCREKAGVGDETTDNWFRNLQKMLRVYVSKDIYHADETGLFYKCLPGETPAVSSKACRDGDMSTERLTVLLCTNSDGSNKLQPLVIGKYQNPQCFKNIKSHPVKYYANKKAWMTVEIFKSFLHTLDSTMEARRRKILLFVDDCVAHPKDVKFLQNVKVVFYPPMCTSKHRPLDTGVIKCFKEEYRKLLVRKVSVLLDAKSCSSSVECKPNILEAIHSVAASWKKISSVMIRNCFARCGIGREMVPSSTEVLNDGDFEDDFKKLDGKNVGFEAYASCDVQVATCGIKSGESCWVPGDSDEEAGDTSAEPHQTTPTFSEAHTALETLKTFCYAHSLSEHDQETLMQIEDMLLQLRTSHAASC